MSCDEFFFDERAAMYEAAALRILEGLRAGIEKSGSASMVVSGGTTPIPLFQRLAREEFAWEKVVITLADERWVPVTSPHSNERLVKEHLLTGHAAHAGFVGLFTGHENPEAGAETCETRLKQIKTPFDVVFLGMGNDGHTASLFPGGDHLKVALNGPGDQLCCPMNAPGAGHPRLTLTLAALLDCRDLLLICTGQDKLKVYHKAGQEGEVEALPIRAVIRNGRLSLFWSP